MSSSQSSDALLLKNLDPYFTLFEQSPLGIIIVNLKGEIVRINQKFSDLLGYDQKALQQMKVSDITHDDDQEKTREIMFQLVSKKKEWIKVEKKYLRKDQSIFWSRSTINLICDEAGEPAFMVALAEDISEQKQIEALKQEQEVLLQKIADTSPNIAYLYDLVEQRNIWQNRHVASVMGYTPEQIQEMGSEFVPSLCHPDDLAKVMAHFGGIQSAADGEVKEVDYRMKHINGGWRWFRSRDTVFKRTPEGQVQQFVGAAIDITKQKRAEEALRESEEKLRSVLEGADAIISLLDMDGKVQYVNHVMDGIDKAAFLNSNIHDWMTPDLSQMIRENMAIVAKTQKTSRYENSFTPPGGEQHDFLHVMSPVMKEGEVVGVSIHTHDITNIKAADKALHESEGKLRSVLEGTDAIVTLLDMDGKVQYVNHVVEGIDKETFMNSNIHDWMTPDLSRLIRKNMALVSSTKKATRYETDFTPPGGEPLDFLHVMSPVLQDGEVIGVSVHTNDITSIKAADKALRESEGRLRAILEGIDAIVTLLDLDGNFLYVNQVLPGIDKERLLKGSVFDVSPPEVVKLVKKHMALVLKNKKPSRYEGQFESPLGIKYDMYNSMSPVIQDGEVTGFLIITNDISEIKQMGRDLERAQFCMDNAIDGIIMHNKQGDIIYANQASADFVGRDIDDLVKANATEFDVHLDSNKWANHWESIKKQKSLLTERILKVSDGSEIIVETVANHQVFNKEEYLISFSRDITDRKRVEMALKESEGKWRAFVEGTDAMVTLLDLDGRVRYINHTLPGIHREDYIGSIAYDWFYPEQARRFQMLVEEVSHTQTSKTLEEEIPDPSGTLHYFYHVFSPMYIGNELAGISVISNNISEVKKLEQELHRNTELMTLGLEAAEMGTWEWDVANSGKLKWDENLHRLFGWEAGTFPGNYEAFISCIFEEDQARVRAADDHAFDKLDHYEGSYRIVRNDNQKVVWTSFRSKFFRNELGDPILMRGVIWDSSKEKEREIMRQKAIELEIQNKELKQFTFIASHDLQGPLKTVSNYVGLIEKSYKGQLDDRADTYLRFISNAVNRMKNLIRDLLDYSRIGQKRETSRIDCARLVQGVLEDLNHEIEECQAKITVQSLPHLTGFETELKLLFQNLISNALKFRKEGVPPIIHISARQEGSYWTFSVKDNGIGIEPEFHKKIFEIFQRLHTYSEYKGTGIGLAHCQKIVDLHGGKIWVESTLNEGSQFFFSILIQP